MMSSLLYMTVYRNFIVTSYYFFVLLKQTTEVKTLPVAHITQFHSSHPAMSQSVTAEASVQARILPFGIHKATKLTLCVVFRTT